MLVATKVPSTLNTPPPVLGVLTVMSLSAPPQSKLSLILVPAGTVVSFVAVPPASKPSNAVPPRRFTFIEGDIFVAWDMTLVF